MTYDRKSKGNIKGIEETVKASDPLERHIFMIPQSMAKMLESIVFNSKEKTNKSKLVRGAIIKQYLSS